MNCSQCGGAQTERVVRVRREVVLGLYGLGAIVAFTLAGDLLHDLAEGIQRSLLPLWKLWITLAVFGVAILAARERRRVEICERCGEITAGWLFTPLGREQSDRALAAGTTRRIALRILGAGGATLAAIAAGIAAAFGRNRGWIPVANDFFLTKVESSAPTVRPEWAGSKVRSYRRLGRTNAVVSDISLGSGRIDDVRVAQLALDRGVTYFDTSPDYSANGSELVLGQALRGRRKDIFLATKFCVADGHLPNDTPVPKIIAAVEGSLQRLKTDYVDLIHVHSCDRIDRLMAPNIHEAFDRLKEQGKVRFLGFSSHTPDLEVVANQAIDSGRFDVMMLAYHFGMWPKFAEILAKAKAHDVGVVAMKTLKGAKHANLAKFRDEASAYSQAAFRWVLSNPNVSCLVISFYKPEHVDEYLYASGTQPQASDVALLDRYDQLIAGDYCQPHCGECLGSCPYGLPINDVLRYRMYAKDYGWRGEGVRHYAKLDVNATACAGCAAPCANVCPIGVSIPEKMLDAHRELSLIV